MTPDQQQPDWLRRFLWLRFIPLKLHLVFAFVGAAIGDFVAGNPGVPPGMIVGGLIGIPLQFLKHRCAHAATGKPSLIQPMPEGLDLNLRRNTLQAAGGLVVAIIAAPIGYSLPDEARFLAALIAAILGFILGVFIVGFGIMIAHYVTEFRTKVWR